MWNCGKDLNRDLLLLIGNMEKANLSQLGICKLDSKKRITLPSKVLEILNLEIGDYVSVEHNNGTICILKGYFVVKGRNNYNGGGNDGSARKC